MMINVIIIPEIMYTSIKMLIKNLVSLRKTMIIVIDKVMEIKTPSAKVPTFE